MNRLIASLIKWLKNPGVHFQLKTTFRIESEKKNNTRIEMAVDNLFYAVANNISFRDIPVKLNLIRSFTEKECIEISSMTPFSLDEVKILFLKRRNEPNIIDLN